MTTIISNVFSNSPDEVKIQSLDNFIETLATVSVMVNHKDCSDELFCDACTLMYHAYHVAHNAGCTFSEILIEDYEKFMDIYRQRRDNKNNE